MHALLAAWPPAATEDPWLIALAIIAATFVHEDIATVTTGMLVADGVIGADIALPALYIGIMAGDVALYGLGRLIALGRFLPNGWDGARFSALKAWLGQRLVAGVLMVRFLPGLRLPAYSTYGFFALPFRRFAIAVVFAVSLWTTGLFYLAYEFGDLTAHWLGILRWPVMISAAIVALFGVERIVRSRLPAAAEDARG